MPEPSRMRWSVVIPAYQPDENLTVALESVLAAIGDRSDIEVVVVDDASPNPIVLPTTDPRVRLRRFDDNVGAVPNFNRSLAEARGTYVHILHADDYVEPDFYNALEWGLEHHAVVAAVCGVQRVDASGSVTEIMKPERTPRGIWHQAQSRLAVSNRVPAPSIVVRRKIYDEIGGFDESLVHAADWDMWLRVALHGNVFYDPAPLAAYRVHDGQHTASVVRTGRNIDEAVALIERLGGRIEDPNQARRLATRALLYRAAYALRTVATSFRSGDARTATVQLRAAAGCVARAMGVAARGFFRRSAADPSS